jgi:outer membrane protein assembly factor BamA
MDLNHPLSIFNLKRYHFRSKNLAGMVMLIAVFLLQGCTGTGKLPEGKKLYKGATVKLKSDKEIPTEKTLLPQLEAVITPEPSASFLGIRPKVAIYNFAGGDKKKKGFMEWIRTSLGEPPVLYDSVNNRKNTDLMLNRLNNNGYFNSRVEVQKKETKKTVALTYIAHVAQPYRISEVTFPTGDSSQTQIHQAIAATKEGSRLKVGGVYNLNTLVGERQRIDSLLKNQGYFYFGPDFILFKADSSYRDHTVKLYVTLKPGTPEKSRRPYTLNKIIIYTDYTIGYDTIPMKPPVVVRDYRYYPDENSLRAKRLLPSVFLEPGKLYARRDHALTMSRLMGLGLFKFVDINFTDADSVAGKLNAAVRLTPMLNQSFRTELEMVSKTNGFAGPGINFSFRHRNLFRGAELLVVTVRAGTETQVSKRNTDSNAAGSNATLNSIEIGTTADLYVPRFITPFRVKNLRSEFVPKTRFRIGYDYQNRTNYYQLNGYTLSYSYIWKSKRTVTHEITPINIQLTKLLNRTPTFDSILANNRYLAQSFQEQFIIGSMYYYTFDTRLIPGKRDNFYLNTGVDFSGNLLGLLTGSFGNSKEKPITFAGNPFSQYSRFDLDFRYYHTFQRASVLATRMIIGVGIPYGNSNTLPYIKQYFIGGTNSIRAFRARSIGPGVFTDSTTSGFFDQSGDIKLETNVEYRFDLVKPYIKGALFVDAGNIWLSQKVADKPGGEFHFNTFLNELAIGTGFGIRIDAQVVVIRFDVGIPVRAPFEAADKRNVLKIPPPSQDMVLNIAIGYPF